MTTSDISCRVNERRVNRTVATAELLSEFLRDELGLTGTKRGCDTAKCGACTVLLDGDPVKACNLLAVQVDGRTVTTIEGLEGEDGLAPTQEAFWDAYGFQCGYCTPGFVMNVHALLRENPDPTEAEIRRRLKGNICRCTGYVNIVESVKALAEPDGGDDGDG